jgi:hypothetical protein
MKYKTSQGNWLTQSLFIQFGKTEFTEYSLTEDYERDGVVYPSLKSLFVSLNDPSEYEIAQLFGGWSHWKTITTSKAIKPYIDAMRDELAVKLRGEGLKQIIKQASTAKGYSAARYLADKSWIPRTKVENVKRNKEQARLVSEFEDDLDRINAPKTH